MDLEQTFLPASFQRKSFSSLTFKLSDMFANQIWMYHTSWKWCFDVGQTYCSSWYIFRANHEFEYRALWADFKMQRKSNPPDFWCRFGGVGALKYTTVSSHDQQKHGKDSVFFFFFFFFRIGHCLYRQCLGVKISHFQKKIVPFQSSAILGGGGNPCLGVKFWGKSMLKSLFRVHFGSR